MGGIPPPNVLSLRKTPCGNAPIRSTKMDSYWGRAIISSIANTPGDTARPKFWNFGTSMGRTRVGAVVNTISITPSDVSTLVLSPRFCIAEKHGLQQAKYSVRDGLSRSAVNSTVRTGHAYFPQDLDAPVAHARLRTKLGATDLRARSVDYSNAYQAIGIHESSHEAATVCFVNPNDNVPHKANVITHPIVDAGKLHIGRGLSSCYNS